MEFKTYSPCRGNSSACATRILASGFIQQDSHKKLAAFIAKQGPMELASQSTIVFNSPGGSVLGGIEMGRFIRKHRYDTELVIDADEEYLKTEYETDFRTVAKNTVCASACTLAFMGGVSRSIEPGSRLGVHQFFTGGGADGGESAAQVTITKLALYTDEMGVDRKILDFASMTGPQSMYWVPDLLARELRIDNTRPVLVPWSLITANDGMVLVNVRQPIAPNRDVIVMFQNGNGAAILTVFAMIAKNSPNVIRQQDFPIGEALNVEFVSPGQRSIKPLALANWTRKKTSADGTTIFAATATISYADLKRFGAFKEVRMYGNFSNALRDLSIDTDLSAENLQGHIALLLRLQNAP